MYKENTDEEKRHQREMHYQKWIKCHMEKMKKWRKGVNDSKKKRKKI